MGEWGGVVGSDIVPPVVSLQKSDNPLDNTRHRFFLVYLNLVVARDYINPVFELLLYEEAVRRT
jgi:hypothetical protein